MATKRTKAFVLQAVPRNEGLQITLPAPVVRGLSGHRPPANTVPMYGVLVNGMLQLSYERYSMSCPVAMLRPEQFLPAEAAPAAHET